MKAHILFLALFPALLSPLVAGDANLISAQPGHTFTLTLDSNPTTGYRWQLAKPVDEKCVKFNRSEYRKPSTQLIGAGGKEIWTFKAVASGKAEIQLEYIRPWETNAPPARTTNFLVTVEQSGS